MRKTDLNKVVFFSKNDMAGGHHLRKGEHILKLKPKQTYTDINNVLELYNLKKYIDNDVFLNSWTSENILDYKQKASKYSEIVGRFMSSINDTNILNLYDKLLNNYISSFWELVNTQSVYKRISKENLRKILIKEPNLIHEILNYKNIVEKYNYVLKDFLLTYSKSAEILLSFYEEKKDLRNKKKVIPKSLTVEHKETIISNYLDSNKTNLNYIGLVQNVRNGSDFKISDRTRLKAKRLYKKETEKFLEGKKGMSYGVSISFPENPLKIIDEFVDDNLIAHYSYSLDYIKRNNTPYFLFKNFKNLFDYLDEQNRITLVSKRSEMGLLEKIVGVHSKNEYRGGTSFSLSEITSQAQIFTYSKVIDNLNDSLENIIYLVFTSIFRERYSFADNARFSVPTATSYLDKVRLLAPEFESILKQFKLFVEDGSIDFELLQISSSPTTIGKIPSLNRDKYIYLNQDNDIIVGCSNLFFSDQAHLTYIEPFKENQYLTFFDLLANEEKVKFSNYEYYQRPQLNYLIEKGFISIDKNDFIEIVNPTRLLILKDLNDNDVGSYYNYQVEFQEEVQSMFAEGMVYFESSLFSKPEQDYFNYLLNKSEFTNGLDLRNSYLHGTQANSDEVEKHEYAYFIYLKLLFLTLLKMDDDLNINFFENQKNIDE